jgi:hypothetical protein
MNRAGLVALLLTAGSAGAVAQGVGVPIKPATGANTPAKAAPPIAVKPAGTTPAPAAAAAAPDPSTVESDIGATSQPLQPAGPMVLLLRGLDKITGRATNIVAPIGKPQHFFTLTITARYCYSTPASETPETAAFVQIDDQRPEQESKRIFSGWMYASSPGLNAVQHPLYDVWAISCNTNMVAPPAIASTAPVKVQSPDATDKESATQLPADAGK